MDSVLRQFSSTPRLILWTLLALLVASSSFAVSGDDFIAAICGPLAGAPSWPQAFLMWSAMSLAMMLPTAAPMLSTYLDIAEAAAAKSVAVAPPAVLAAGYAAVWLGFSGLAATAQWAMPELAKNETAAGLLLIGAGLYQFAPLKHACLTKCRRPMQYFLGHWSARTAAVFRMGLDQGALCLGCCWALMLIAFAAGFMNPVWMAGLAFVMVLEKTLPEPKPVIYGLGLGLIGAGLVLIA